MNDYKYAVQVMIKNLQQSIANKMNRSNEIYTFIIPDWKSISIHLNLDEG